MKESTITCDVIQDLLPLYVDQCCSEQSKKIVEEHLSSCEECQKRHAQFQSSLTNALTEQTIENTTDNHTGNENKEREIELAGIRQGMRKINRWKIRGIISLCLALLLIFVALPIWNYVNGSGLTYTNLKAAYTAAAFEKALVSGDYERAYRYLDIKSHYDDLLATDVDAILHSNNEANAKAIEKGIRQIKENGFDWYDEICKEKFLENMKILEDMGETLFSYSNFHIDTQPFGYCIYFNVQTQSKADFRMGLQLTSDGIQNFNFSIMHDAYDSTTGEYLSKNELEGKALIFDRLYRSPSINETVMEILYGDTDYDWTQLFVY